MEPMIAGMLAAWLQRRPARWRAASFAAALRVAAVAVAVVGVAGSVLIATGWQATVNRQRDERLDRGAASRTVAITSALAHYEDALQAARSLWMASSHVNRQEFAIFAMTLGLERRYPGLEAVGWRERVTADAADEFVRRVRGDGEHGFTISPPGRRPVYYVMKYGYPRMLSPQLGRDARAIPSILATLDRARDTGATTLSNQTTLPADMALPAARRPAAYELFVPVYQSGALSSTVTQRRARLLGWASCQFRASDLLRAALATTQQFTGVELHDQEVDRGSLVGSYPPGFRADGPNLRTEEFEFGGRRFLLRYAPLPGNPALTERTIPARLVFGVGAVVSLLLFGLLWLLAQVGTLYQEVGRLAHTDALTGVANRRAWDDELPVGLAGAARSGQPLAVALIDHDHFKAYNDEHGHQAGDRLLKAAAAAWQGRLRKTDLLARYGGEEFALLLPDCGLDSAMEIAERIRTAQPEGTCSIGVAVWDFREGPAELVARADRALYAAKQGGRDRCRADQPAGAASAAWTPVR
jgi:diguanylate cyclase (GGDEF)-like protein